MVIPTAIDVLHNLLKAQSVDKELKVKLMHMIDSDTNDLESFHLITEIDKTEKMKCLIRFLMAS